MISQQKKILIIAGIIFVVTIVFILIFRYGMHLFVDEFDYFKPLVSNN